MSLGGAAGIAGGFVTGVLLDRYRVNWVGGVTLVVMAVAFALLMDDVRSRAFIVFALIINGYAAGTNADYWDVDCGIRRPKKLRRDLWRDGWAYCIRWWCRANGRWARI